MSDVDGVSASSTTTDAVSLQAPKECVALSATIAKLAAKAAPVGKALKRLLEHERALLESNQLINVTHLNATSVIFLAPCAIVDLSKHALVYRPMGDTEVQFLIANGQLPDTQPYQAIIEGHNGRLY